MPRKKTTKRKTTTRRRYRHSAATRRKISRGVRKALGYSVKGAVYDTAAASTAKAASSGFGGAAAIGRLGVY